MLLQAGGVVRVLRATSRATAMGGAVDPVIKAQIEKIGKNAAVHHVVKHQYLRVTELGKQFANICMIRKA
jgi:hypothetical protein